MAESFDQDKISIQLDNNKTKQMRTHDQNSSNDEQRPSETDNAAEVESRPAGEVNLSPTPQFLHQDSLVLSLQTLKDDYIDQESVKKINESRLSRFKRLIGKKSEKEQEEEEVERDWSDYTSKQKAHFVIASLFKIIIFIILLYFFLLSLCFMTIGFTLVSGVALKGTDVIRFLLNNPFAALSIGIIVTAIMQNATATTSIAVSMVGAGIIPSVRNAIPIIMGSNIGTCFTNSLIALTLAGDPNEFKRAFSAATLNDMFNFLTTAILLPLEIFSDFLLVMSQGITSLIPFENAQDIAKANFVGSILNPFIDVFILLNVTAVDELAKGNQNVSEIALRCCNQAYILSNASTNTWNETSPVATNETVCLEKCTYWCMPMLKAFGDAGTGLFWIIFSILVLIACLFGIVKVLSLLIVGPIAKGVRKGLNASLPGKMKWFTQVILFIVALLLTLIVQSSNIITATLVPLCGIGLISLQRVYVMTLGSNIGTTVTGLLSAFTLSPASMEKGLQLAFVYTFFNVFGVLFWLPIPPLRFPKKLARSLGHIVFRYRWFLYVYMFTVYFIVPAIVFALALIPYWIGLAVFGLPVLIVFIGYLIVLILRKCMYNKLPEKLKSFNWLPEWMNSLEPYDRAIKRVRCCKRRSRQVHPEIDHDIDIQLSSYERRASIPDVVRQMSALSGLIKEARRSQRGRQHSNSDSETSSSPTTSLDQLPPYSITS